jgi:hypothetical protein
MSYHELSSSCLGTLRKVDGLSLEALSIDTIIGLRSPCEDLTRDSKAPKYVFFEFRMQKLWEFKFSLVHEPKPT